MANINKITFDGNTLIDLTGDTVGTGTDKVVSGYTFHGSDGAIRTGTATALNGETRDVTLSASPTTYTPSTGKNAITSIKVTASSGSAGTPSATKGTVSNNQVSITPSVTNTTGWISGSTKTGTAVTVTASELVSGTKTITSSGSTDVTNYASASVAEGALSAADSSISGGSFTPALTYNSTSGKFDYSGGAAASGTAYAKASTAGYVTSSQNTSKSLSATVSATGSVNKVGTGATISGTTTKAPTLSRTAKPSGDTWTDAASGAATTTKPSSGYYVQIDAAANTGTLTATPKVTSAGYGDTTNYSATAATITVGAAKATTAYVPIKAATTSKTDATASASVSKNPSASTSVSGMETTTTDTGFSVSASAASGTTTASVTASSASVSAGYSDGVATSTAAKSATSTEQTASETKYIIASSVTNNTTLPSGTSSSGTINRGSYIKFAKGYNSTDKYYQAQADAHSAYTPSSTYFQTSTTGAVSAAKIEADKYAASAYYVKAGSAGTPSAAKGTVSNHSVSVTPSVTNTTGWITGDTKSGTAVTVSASELVSGNKSLSSSTSDQTNIDVTNYKTVSVSKIASGSATGVVGTPTYKSHTQDSSNKKKFTITETITAPAPTISAGYISSGTAGTSADKTVSVTITDAQAQAAVGTAVFSNITTSTATDAVPLVTTAGYTGTKKISEISIPSEHTLSAINLNTYSYIGTLSALAGSSITGINLSASYVSAMTVSGDPDAYGGIGQLNLITYGSNPAYISSLNLTAQAGGYSAAHINNISLISDSNDPYSIAYIGNISIGNNNCYVNINGGDTDKGVKVTGHTAMVDGTTVTNSSGDLITSSWSTGTAGTSAIATITPSTSAQYVKCSTAGWTDTSKYVKVNAVSTATFSNITTSTSTSAVPLVTAAGYTGTKNISELTVPRHKTLSKLYNNGEIDHVYCDSSDDGGTIDKLHMNGGNVGTIKFEVNGGRIGGIEESGQDAPVYIGVDNGIELSSDSHIGNISLAYNSSIGNIYLTGGNSSIGNINIAGDGAGASSIGNISLGGYDFGYGSSLAGLSIDTYSTVNNISNTGTITKIINNGSIPEINNSGYINVKGGGTSTPTYAGNVQYRDANNNTRNLVFSGYTNGLNINAATQLTAPYSSDTSVYLYGSTTDVYVAKGLPYGRTNIYATYLRTSISTASVALYHTFDQYCSKVIFLIKSITDSSTTVYIDVGHYASASRTYITTQLLSINLPSWGCGVLTISRDAATRHFVATFSALPESHVMF